MFRRNKGRPVFPKFFTTLQRPECRLKDVLKRGVTTNKVSTQKWISNGVVYVIDNLRYERVQEESEKEVFKYSSSKEKYHFKIDLKMCSPAFPRMIKDFDEKGLPPYCQFPFDIS